MLVVCEQTVRESVTPPLRSDIVITATQNTSPLKRCHTLTRAEPRRTERVGERASDSIVHVRLAEYGDRVETRVPSARGTERNLTSLAAPRLLTYYQ